MNPLCSRVYLRPYTRQVITDICNVDRAEFITVQDIKLSREVEEACKILRNSKISWINSHWIFYPSLLETYRLVKLN